MNRIHYLKISSIYYDKVIAELKRFELRLNDRGFELGDYLILREIVEPVKRITGRECLVRIVYMTQNFTGLEPGWAILSIKKLAEEKIIHGSTRNFPETGCDHIDIELNENEKHCLKCHKVWMVEK